MHKLLLLFISYFYFKIYRKKVKSINIPTVVTQKRYSKLGVKMKNQTPGRNKIFRRQSKIGKKVNNRKWR